MYSVYKIMPNTIQYIQIMHIYNNNITEHFYVNKKVDDLAFIAFVMLRCY